MIRAAFLQAAGGALTVAQAQPFAATLRMAVVAPASGDAAPLGRQLVAGVRAAVDYANYNRPAFARALLFDSYDDHDDVANALTQASFATGSPDVVAVIGHLSAAPTLAALQTYASANVALVVPTVTDDRLTARGYRNVFRLPVKDSDEGALGAAYAIAAGSKAPLAVTRAGADYGADVASGFVRRAGAQHLSVPALAVADGDADFGAAAAAVLARAPDCVYLAGTTAALGPLLEALRAHGYSGRVLASQGFFDPALLSAHAKAAEGLTVSTNVPYYPLAPIAQREVSDYQERNGPLPPVTAYGYAAVQLVAAAARRVTAVNRLTILRALATNGNLDTITGSYSFAPSGDAVIPNCYFYVVRDGKFVYDRQARAGGFMLK